ncbi:FAD-dependent oxidoreductase, partial [bacterium]|nr:FAD-dependent oxidoreductase [bacterium]
MNILNKNRISRRHFTKEILYKGGLLAVSGFGSCFFFKNATAADTLQKKLSQAIDGRVITSTILLKEYSYDFGHMIRKEPRIVVVPKSREDILKVFEIADSFGVPISIRGCGHSCIGQSLSDGGIILHNYKTTAGYSKNKDMLTVSSNTEISLLEKSLNTHGLTNPVLPYFLDLTLGGVLSAGGVGPLSIKRGILAENINKLTLITPQGESVTCSAEKNS